MATSSSLSTPYADYRAYKLARLLSDALGCGELIQYQIRSVSEVEAPSTHAAA